MSNKFQNEDFKSSAELASAGGSDSQLLNTTKIWSPKSAAVLESVLRKNNFAASVAPTVSNDTTQGYEPGSTWVDVVAGKIYTNINNTTGAAVWKEAGSGGGGISDLDALVLQNFENAALGDFTQTDLELVSNTLHGTQGARLTHHASTQRLFKQTIAADRKFRGFKMNIIFDIQSSASQGNVTLTVKDETNNVTLLSQLVTVGSFSQTVNNTNASPTLSGFTATTISSVLPGMIVTGTGIPAGTRILSVNTTALTATMSANATSSNTGISLRFSALPARWPYSFTIPQTCLSVSYQFTALTEAGLPETYIDDIRILKDTQPLVSTSVSNTYQEVQSSAIRQTVSFGNVDITGALTESNGSGIYSYNSGTGVYTVIKGAQFNISATFRAAGAATTQPIIVDSAAVIEYGSDSSLASTGARACAAANVYLGAGATFKIRQGAGGGTTNEQYINVTATYTEQRTSTIPLVQSGFVTTGDTTSLAAGNGGQSVTANVTNIPFIPVVTNGSQIVLLSDSFQVTETGVYDLAGSIRLTTGANRAFYVYEDGVAQDLIGYGSFDVYPFSVSRVFTAGKVYSIRSSVTATLVNDTTLHYLKISRQGNIKQINVNNNSKAEFETSEIAFNGSNSRGAVATNIVKFDSISRLRGDAFAITNTANDGTYLTVLKDGYAQFGANLDIGGGAGQAIGITLNQQTLTGVPENSAFLTRINTVGTSYSTNTSTPLMKVKVGDIIRVYASQNPTTALYNIFTAYWFAMGVSMSVSNTLPQFSDSDTRLLAGAPASGQALTSNVTDVAFVATTDTAGTWSGTQYRVARDQLLTINASIYLTTNVSAVVNLFKNGSFYKRISSLQNSNIHTASGLTEYFQANDIISIRFEGTGTTQTGASPYHYLSITGVGRPQVTGVDVTPFITIPQSVTDSISYISPTVTSTTADGPIRFTNGLLNSTNRGVLSIVDESSPARTRFVALKRCTVRVSFNCYITTLANFVYIYKNNTIVGYGSQTGAANWNSAGSGTYTLEAGEYIMLGSTAAALNNGGGVFMLGITATADSDNIVSENDVVSSDNMAFRWVGSSEYTLATLPNAPVGTVVTVNTTINTNNTKTQSTARPTQTDAQFSQQGLRLYTRPYNTAGQNLTPSYIAIQIGKGLKGVRLAVYSGPAKTGTMMNAAQQFIISNTQVGSDLSYDENTGILTLDAATTWDTNYNTRYWLDNTGNAQTNAYVVFTASKNPALTGLNPLTHRVAILRDEKASGTNGATPTSGVYVTRQLTVMDDASGIVSNFSSNQFTLAPGEYLIESSAPAYGNGGSSSDWHKTRLRNITLGVDALIGSSERMSTISGVGITNRSHIVGRVVVATNTVFELQHRVATGIVGGFGYPSSFGDVEVYAIVKITKLK